MNGGQGKIAGASVVAVAHENHIVAGLPVLREAAEDGVDNPVEVFGGVDERIGEVDVLKFPGFFVRFFTIMRCSIMYSSPAVTCRGCTRRLVMPFSAQSFRASLTEKIFLPSFASFLRMMSEV